MSYQHSSDAWRLSAIELASQIRAGELSARESVDAMLERIEAINPQINALSGVNAFQVRSAADAADAARARGEPLGPLHGVPVTIKVNVDVAGSPTDGGIVAYKDAIAPVDAPLVANLRKAGAIVIGRNNAPCFSLRWFTDNDLHGRTLNPWDHNVTPGGSSGGAAAAVATGMGPIAHGNDYGGSIRYPAWACGVVGLRTTPGRVPAFNPSSKAERTITNQLMAVQGPLTRTVADARLALEVMAQGDPHDPLWVPAPLSYPSDGEPLRVAIFTRNPAGFAHPSVVKALDEAARWLSEAGCIVEEAELPHFQEAADLWRQLLADDMRRASKLAIDAYGDRAVKYALSQHLAGCGEFDRDRYLAALDRRLTIARVWSLFLQRYSVVLMPISWDRQFPIDEDCTTPERAQRVFAMQSPLTSTAMLGLPSLSVPVGLSEGLPTGVQLIAARYREDLCLKAGEIIERASGFSALERLAS